MCSTPYISCIAAVDCDVLCVREPQLERKYTCVEVICQCMPVKNA